MTNEKQIDEILAEVKTRLMKEIKQEIVNGVWYKSASSTKHSVCFTDVNNRVGYGISILGFETDKWGMSNLTTMSYDEIKDMLVKHANSLGIKEGAVIDKKFLPKLNSYDLFTIKSVKFEYNKHEDLLFIDDNTVYEKGIWATVVKEKTSEEWVNTYTYRNSLKDFMLINNLEFIQRK